MVCSSDGPVITVTSFPVTMAGGAIEYTTTWKTTEYEGATVTQTVIVYSSGDLLTTVTTFTVQDDPVDDPTEEPSKTEEPADESDEEPSRTEEPAIIEKPSESQ
ncbi:hypothetical protein Cantr_00797 [Candida viswanathii]|uniref:Uncharacterized protein n=1 Tax=Candida viswanathii TaxID=5486 RepID=A0A367YH03_9ASCO|nr:hypothetical protein Cantr_00797 [Candida viswanathii]